jgi:hypothetical protein
MRTSLNDLSTGDFFVWGEQTEDESLNIYQKIDQIGEYNCVLINTGKPCIIFPSSPILNKISIEMITSLNEE